MKTGTTTRKLVAIGAALTLALTLAPTAASAANYKESDYPKAVMTYRAHPAGFNDAAEVTTPGPRCSITTTVVSAGGVRVSVRNELASLVRELLARTKQMGYTMEAASTGGYNCRYIGGTTTPSNHAYGRAVDINWNQNPHSYTFRSTIPPAVVKMWMNAGFYWGGHYAKHDTMHFEYVGAKSAIGTYYKKLTGQSVPTPPTPPAATETSFPSLKQGSTNTAAVRTLQYGLTARGYSLTADGVFGAKTKAALVKFQKAKGLAADGIAGAKTWPAVLPTVKSGSTGAAVKALQTELRAAGYSLTVDGSFGAKTKAAVVAYQKAQRLTADGIVGAKTWGSLVD
ncbi:peptidoglycan-binding protein [Microbacterium invictum]|uniref:Uncharacterized protein n=1 Tax=Microbacterium invictum TaxID=515415 RepID=A0AA40SNK3_9MICO|nr:peptidoglycan-binding protein [Microbacterium invictum]MBB4139476.1 hypothetical protein [Microbacterium invictum]